MLFISILVAMYMLLFILRAISKNNPNLAHFKRLINMFQTVLNITLAVLLSYLGSVVTLYAYNKPTHTVDFSDFYDLAEQLINKKRTAILLYNITLFQFFLDGEAKGVMQLFRQSFEASICF